MDTADTKKTESQRDALAPTSRATEPSRFPVVGIGASAGGLEALKALFANMPTDTGACFLVVTHQAPDRQSLLAELLGYATAMPVLDVTEGMALAPDHVVIAKDGGLDLIDHCLSMTKGEDQTSTLRPVDHFFRSLAVDQGERSIGIVLSGAGNDGTLGVEAIAAAGGMVMVQDPDTAGYAGMPAAARATGLADYVLAPDQMGPTLAQYVRGPYLRRARNLRTPLLPAEDIRAIMLRLRSRTGHDFTGYKPSTVSRRILRRMGVHRIEEPHAYLKFLTHNPHELDLLFRELLISVTSFFRDPEAFDALAQTLPGLIDRHEDETTFRVWVAGCASGEEAYSVAIVVDEALRGRERKLEVQVFATDLDERAIATARAGIYPEGIAADISSERLERYFVHKDSNYRIKKEIRDRMVFASQNVINDPPFTNMDLVVCRNLLIYLDVEVQERVLPTFHYALRPGGILFLGSAESAGAAEDLFEKVDDRHRVLRRREVRPRVHPAALLSPNRMMRASHLREGSETGVSESRGPSPDVQRVLLNMLVPPTALVDERGMIVYLHGRSGLYLEPEQGEPRNNLFEMARPGLRQALTALLHQASKGAPVERSGVRVQTNGSETLVDLKVTPVKSPETLRGLYLVSFRPPAQPRTPVETSDRAEPSLEREDELERELQYTRESLQSTVEELETANEELQSSNEEMQSSNEELTSTNEELETSREEMQSLNEELATVNAELESKVDALARSNNDLQNLLNSMQLATLFLDEDLRVQRFTDHARRMVRLIETDVGRPLSDLASDFDYDGLADDCRRVLATLEPRHVEVQGSDGRWYLLRVMPYRTSENVIEGLVVLMVDIDRVKRAELEAVASREMFKSVVNTVRGPLLVLDGALRVVSANDSFYRTFEVWPRGTEGLPVYQLGDGQWDLPELRRLLEEILPEDSVVTDYRVEREFPEIGRRTFLINARRLDGGYDGGLILLALEDVSAGGAAPDG